MALYDGGNWDDGYVSHVQRSGESGESCAASECEIEPLLSSYPDISIVDFTNMVSFKAMCWDLCNGLVEGRGCPYMAFLHVSPSMFEAIERLRVKRSCPIPRMSILYDKVDEVLITKIMVGVSHDVCGHVFEQRLVEMFGNRNSSIVTVGSGRQGTTTRRSKEADVAFTPTSRDVTSQWPSVVVEVGASQSLTCLRGDLSYWLRSSNGMTRVAILLHIDKDDETILIERWEVVPRGRSARANTNYGPTVAMAESILLDARSVYTGVPLTIPASLVYDNVPANVGPGQYALSAPDLDYFNNIYWAAMNVVPRRY